jgi:hypothetical protein
LEKTLRAETAGTVAVPAASVSVGYDAKASPPPAPPMTYISELITLLIGSPEFQQR